LPHWQPAEKMIRQPQATTIHHRESHESHRTGILLLRGHRHDAGSRVLRGVLNLTPTTVNETEHGQWTEYEFGPYALAIGCAPGFKSKS
jgi:hypothetical protein